MKHCIYLGELRRRCLHDCVDVGVNVADVKLSCQMSCADMDLFGDVENCKRLVKQSL